MGKRNVSKNGTIWMFLVVLHSTDLPHSLTYDRSQVLHFNYVIKEQIANPGSKNSQNKNVVVVQLTRMGCGHTKNNYVRALVHALYAPICPPVKYSRFYLARKQYVYIKVLGISFCVNFLYTISYTHKKKRLYIYIWKHCASIENSFILLSRLSTPIRVFSFERKKLWRRSFVKN